MYLQSINIQLDSSVQSITRVAAMCLSGAIANGIVLSGNENPDIRICKNKIEFGRCYTPELQGLSGMIFQNFHLEYGNLVYYYSDAYTLSFWSKSLDYKGYFTPNVPDDPTIFNMIYPKFAQQR